MKTLSSYRRPIGLVLGVYTIALLFGTHLPKDAVVDLHHNDKFIHFVAYFGLSLLAIAYQVASSGFCKRGFVSLVVSLVLFASVDEYTQQYSPGRLSTIGDWVANCAGIGFGTIVCTGLVRTSLVGVTARR